MTENLTGERADLLENLRTRREFLRGTVRGVSDEDAARRTTVSELCLGGLIKHVASTEKGWVDFIVDGPSTTPDYSDPKVQEEYAKGFRMQPGETVEGILAEYEKVAARTDELVATLPDLNAGHTVPAAPWKAEHFWTARATLLHIITETAHHCGHADIIREALDGAKTMG
ncbi:DinB family protein [Actinomadura barringtoniae]|uniref:DinB family protein n=1 Tax=Actinomadura barringtoniae TaxID=1427535 RepID=A0A939T3C6_9ACTN|nr:DinB family protein [Actinomadura barringtoniae]MBO2450936.1 DinB family protein [Actinomadura barringtoniae]